ncbi:hypothetical protein [Sphingobacterium chungjuense]|uniref:hypothetical protein n=1 Tax=Sphingobacterium chungjuense TaxID=2675553 RepID=UPI00140ACF05|nr:hypothetical protein [Sphingobacterium chungjuense]
MAEENQNHKEILIDVKVQNQEAQQQTEALKKKFKDLSDQAEEFEKIDYNNSSIGELRDHLEKAKQNLQALKDTGLASTKQLDDMGKTVNKLKDNLSGMKADKIFKGIEASVMGVVGAGQLLTAGISILGIESESVNESIAKMMSLMSLKDGIESLGKYASGMKALSASTNGATSATNLLKLGFQSLGIGLIISAIVYLTHNWEELKNTVKEFIPQVDGVGKVFSNLMPIVEGVGKAIVGFIVRPIGQAIKAFNLLRDGDWKGAGMEILNAINPLEKLNGVVKDFKSGMSTAIIRKEVTESIAKFNEETEKSIALLEKQGGKEKEIHALKVKQWQNEIKLLQSKNKHISDADKKRIDELNDNLSQENASYGKFLKGISDKANAERQKQIDKAKEDYKKLLDEVKTFITQAQKDIADAGRSERAKELNDLDLHYQEQINKAKQANQSTTDLLEARRIKEAEIKAKYDKSDREAELNKTKLQGETSVLSAGLGASATSIDDQNRIAEARLSSLSDTYQKERELYADNKEQLALIDVKYASDVLQIETDLSNKKKEIQEKEKQLALDKAIAIGEISMFNTDGYDLNTVSLIEAVGQAKLSALKLQYDAEKELYADNKEQLLLLDAEYAANVRLTEKETSDNRNALLESNLGVASAVAGSLGALASDTTAFGRTMAVASATIDTYSGASKALAQGGFAGIGMATAVIASGLANVRKILSTKVEGAKGATPAPSIQAPTINTTTLSRSGVQDVRIANQPQQQNIKIEPVKAYITNKDLSTNADKENFYKANSSF